MKDLGEAKKRIGVEISRDRINENVCLWKWEYLKNELQYSSITKGSKPINTPLAPHFKFCAKLSSNSNKEQKYMASVSCSNAFVA